jgi:hypothetical protein
MGNKSETRLYNILCSPVREIERHPAAATEVIPPSPTQAAPSGGRRSRGRTVE